MRALNNEQQSELFGTEGTLSSLSSKIKIAFAFEIIDKDLRDQFDKIREIRNAFAHSPLHLSFGTPEIRKACVGLLKSEDINKINPRALYANTVIFLMYAGMLGMSLPKQPLPISYDKVSSFLEKLIQQSLEQTQKNPPEENKETIPPIPPESSQA
jgi:hypothetical protein